MLLAGVSCGHNEGCQGKALAREQKKKKELMSFLGMVGYYHSFCWNFYWKMSLPLPV